jgi:hypothetical protein
MKERLKEVIFVTLGAFGCVLLLKSITITIPTEKVSVIQTKPHKKKVDDSVKVTATMYYPVVSQCDSDPLITASMRKIVPHKASEQKWIAMSRDLLKRWGGKFDYGDKIRLVGTKFKDGVYTIVDCMNKRFKNKIDILETQGTKPYKFDNVKIVAL